MKTRWIRLGAFYLVQIKSGFFSSWDTVHKYSVLGDRSKDHARTLAASLLKQYREKEEYK